LRAPRAVVPEVPIDAPATGRAPVGAVRQLPRALHLLPAPGAVAHERHQRTAAPDVRALRRIAPVLVAAVGLDDEARPVAGRAVAPVELRASAAARAARRIARLEAVERRRRAAPGAGLHPLGHRPFAASALILRLEHRPVAAL